MLKRILTKKSKRRAIRCTNGTLLSPNTRLSPAVSHSILMKTRTPQNEGRTTNQKAGSSNLSGRTTPCKKTIFQRTVMTCVQKF
jgi:hypothetical protein